MSSVPPSGLRVSMDDLRQRYKDLCAYRDEVEVNIRPIREELREAQATAEKYRVLAIGVSEKLNKARGGQDWFALKKEIGLLAKALGGQGT